jgi:hypothetical protein
MKASLTLQFTLHNIGFKVSELYMENDSNFKIDKLTCLGESIEQTVQRCHTKV